MNHALNGPWKIRTITRIAVNVIACVYLIKIRQELQSNSVDIIRSKNTAGTGNGNGCRKNTASWVKYEVNKNSIETMIILIAYSSQIDIP